MRLEPNSDRNDVKSILQQRYISHIIKTNKIIIRNYSRVAFKWEW